MSHLVHDMGIARQIGAYSDAVEVKGNLRWLLTSGTPGLSQAGEIPDDIGAQAEIAWRHIQQTLAAAGMTVGDIIKVTQYLTRTQDIPGYSQVRSRFLADARPASMLLIVPALVWPKFLLEIEVIAAK